MSVIFVLQVDFFSIIKPYPEHSSISNCYLLKFRFEWKSERFIATKTGHDSHLEFWAVGFNFILFYWLYSITYSTFLSQLQFMFLTHIIYEASVGSGPLSITMLMNWFKKMLLYNSFLVCNMNSIIGFI